MEMMESYEETRLGPAHVADQCDVKIHETNLAANCSTLMANKQNFDFGAEIVGMQQQQTIVTERECVVKTNNENMATTTATLGTFAVAASTAPIENPVVNIETPLNVAELPTNNSKCTTNVETSQVADLNTAADDDVDADSYQSDDDVDDDTNAAESQQEGSLSMRNDASQESDESTSDSDFSDLSGLSDMSGREWKPISARPINWVQKQIHAGANPRDLLSQMLPSNAQPIAPGVNDMLLWRILASMLSEPPRRQKLRYINTFTDVIQLIQQSKNIIVLTGAGVSVSCGIPDFRSSDGIYSRLAKDFPNLPDPQAMFDINYFSRDPRPFFKFAREIYPGQFKPSPCHRFIKLLEAKQKLLRNYTQNIDTLEQVAGIKNVIECHGSFSTASCTKCKVKCTADAIREDIFSQRIPVCRRCQPNVHQSTNASDAVSDEDLRKIVENGIMKPDIVFFGEGLPEEFHTVMASDKDLCDLLIVIGSSLKVRPVALIPSSIPANIPQILINREQLHHLEFDVELLGDSDVIINQLCHRLGNDWRNICYDDKVLKESKELLPLEEETTTDDSEEDGQQMLDTDTQSVKSSASADLALRSAAGTYSDSGFESSTSSSMVIAKTTATTIEANEAVAKIKHTILDLNQQLTTATTKTMSPVTTTKTKENNLDAIRVNYIEQTNDTVDDFENRAFQPFNARLTEPQQHSTSYDMNAHRHMSIDISKDSGIQGDSSNSGLITNLAGTLPPPVADFGDTGGTTVIDESAVASTACIENHTTAATITIPPIKTQPQTPSTTSAPQAMPNVRNSSAPDCQKSNTPAQLRHQTKKYRTASERLQEGTYYAHETTAAYVFPGAQVSWWSDGEEEEDVNDIIAHEYEAEAEDPLEDANGVPLSPLLPPSVEAEVVSEITTTTSSFGICAKPSNEVPKQAQPIASYRKVNNTSNTTTATGTTQTASTSASQNAKAVVNTTTNERVQLTTQPPQSSPQKRVCECPETTTLSNNSNTNNTIDGSVSCCCSNINSNSNDKCECSPPPLKRKRSTDDQTTKNINEDLVQATSNNADSVMENNIVTAMQELNSGGGGDTPPSTA